MKQINRRPIYPLAEMSEQQQSLGLSVSQQPILGLLYFKRNREWGNVEICWVFIFEKWIKTYVKRTSKVIIKSFFICILI